MTTPARSAASAIPLSRSEKSVEEGGGHHAAVNHHLKLLAPEPFDELARLVGDRHVRVDKLRLDAHDILLRSLLRRRLLLCCRLRLLRLLRARRLRGGREA
jgi:hypothetical protein